MNNLSFRGRWSAKKGRGTHINILEINIVWMACQKFKEVMGVKTISFQMDNTMAVTYLLK